MTPFPEAEIMTIKRLEVALRKMDYKLLKDGAYKLHEKFHGGHKFEYLDLLEEILLEVSENAQVPSDIKDILCPTIEDILLQNSYEGKNQTDIALEQAKERVFDDNRALNQNEEKETKMSAFDAFGSQKPTPQPALQAAPTRFFTQSPFSAQPFKDFNSSPMLNQPHNEPTPLFFENQVNYEQKQEVSKEEYLKDETQQEEIKEENSNINQAENVQVQEQPSAEKTYTEPIMDIQQPQYSEMVQEATPQDNKQEQEIQHQEIQTNEISPNEFEAEVKAETEVEVQNAEEKEVEKKSVAIFYGQDSSLDKIKNIIEYRKLLKDKNSSISDILKLISEISLQANANVVELKGVLEKLKSGQNKVNLITNSQSAMFFEMFDSLNIEYDLNDIEFESDLNLSALYGLSNLFVCNECREKFLDTQTGIKPLVVECPKCKKPMYVEFYAQAEGEEVNMENYNSALVSLANSKVWFLIHPSFNDKTSSDMIESAFRASKTVEEVYILDKDINVRETYKYIFSKINPDVKINVQPTALEDFLNSI